MLKKIFNTCKLWIAGEPVPMPVSISERMHAAMFTRPTNDDFHDLPEEVLLFINKTMTCPYCHGKLFGGPKGGASLNLFCENVDTCDSRFNVVDPEWGFVPMGQFTGPTPPEFKAFIHGK